MRFKFAALHSSGVLALLDPKLLRELFENAEKLAAVAAALGVQQAAHAEEGDSPAAAAAKETLGQVRRLPAHRLAASVELRYYYWRQCRKQRSAWVLLPVQPRAMACMLLKQHQALRSVE